MKAYEWLKATVKKPETWVFLFVFIWVIGGILWISEYLDDILGDPHPIIVLLWGIIGFISCDILQQRVHGHMEKWVYFHIRTKWKFREKPISTLLDLLGPGILPWVLIPLVAAVLACLVLLWDICKADISKFSENLSNFTSIILVFIFMAQTWIFYHQYHHMKQPLLKAPLFWTLFKPKDDIDCDILLKNDGNFPIFNISYHISEVLVKDRWGYKGYKKVKSKEISEDFLPRLDGGSEKEIFVKPTEEFKEMRLAVHINAKTLDGHSTRLLFYKAPKDVDFRLAESVHT